MISFLLYNVYLFVPSLDPVFIYFATILCLLIILIGLGFALLLKRQKRDKLTLQSYLVRIAELNKAVNSLIRTSNKDVFIYDEQAGILYKYDGVDFIRDDITLHGLEKNMHPDDLEQYCKDYSDIINNVKETTVSFIRIYNPDLNKFEQFEYVVCPIERAANGKVIKYIYSRRNISEENCEKAKQTTQSINMHLALRSGGLLNWQFNIDERTSKFLDGNYKEYVLTDEVLLACIDISYRDTYKLFLQQLITNQLSEQSEMLLVKMPNDAEYKKYTITAMAYFDAIDPVIISGVWKKQD